MASIQIVAVEEAVVLKDRSSELLILPDHVVFLKSFSKSKDFAKYFLEEALMNRSARKLYEAWLRKDKGLWRNLYEVVRDIEIKDYDKKLKDLKDAEKNTPPPKKEKVEKEKKKAVKKEEPKKTSKTTKKTASKKTTKKVTKKKTATKKTASKKTTTKKTTTKKKTAKKKKTSKK